MKVIESVDVLEGTGAYLASVALAQYSPTGDYLDHPDLPAVLFAGADVPDTALVLTITGYDAMAGSVFDVALAFRAPARDTRGVDRLADAVAEHFDATMGQDAWTFEAGTVVARPSLTWGELTVYAIERIARGTAELSSESRNTNIRRWVRTDTYRITVDRDE